MRYIDAASREQTETVYAWLTAVLPASRSFGCQTGYFRFDAIAPFTDELERMLENGGEVDVVVGINEDRLAAADLEALFDLLAPWIGSGASLAIVGAANGLFHPKTYYVEHRDGALSALVGSANLTWPGIAHNIESCVIVEPHDDPAVAEAVRASICAWRDPSLPNSKVINKNVIAELVACGDIDASALAAERRRTRSSGRQSARKLFPVLDPIPGIPQRRHTKTPKTATPIEKIGIGTTSFPRNVVGIVKRLSRTDLKGLRRDPGTAYIALPRDLASYIPMQPVGSNGEPRFDVNIEARIDGAISATVTSGHDPVNITHVGEGTTKKSHSDLRLNVLSTMSRELLRVHADTQAALPVKDDVLAIEFFDRARFLRLTFVTHDPLRGELAALCTERRGGWGWLPPRVVPSW